MTLKNYVIFSAAQGSELCYRYTSSYKARAAPLKHSFVVAIEPKSPAEAKLFVPESESPAEAELFGLSLSRLLKPSFLELEPKSPAEAELFGPEFESPAEAELFGPESESPAEAELFGDRVRVARWIRAFFWPKLGTYFWVHSGSLTNF